MARCRGCDAEILWVTLPSGRKHPIDAKPSPTGALVLDGPQDAAGDQRAHFLAAAEVCHKDRYVSHFKTCPQAEQFRGRGRQ